MATRRCVRLWGGACFCRRGSWGALHHRSLSRARPTVCLQYTVGLEGPDSAASEEEVALIEVGPEAVNAAIEEAFNSLNATGDDASLEELGDALRAAVGDDEVKDDALQLVGIE